MIRINVIIPITISILIFTSCATFLKDEDALNLKVYEKDIYSLKEDAGEEKRLITKGEKVRLYIITDDDFIKIYCYPANIDFLKAERTLLLYLLEADFEDKKFDLTFFEEKLYDKVELSK